jgi:hypothetical protein
MRAAACCRGRSAAGRRRVGTAALTLAYEGERCVRTYRGSSTMTTAGPRADRRGVLRMPGSRPARRRSWGPCSAGATDRVRDDAPRAAPEAPEPYASLVSAGCSRRHVPAVPDARSHASAVAVAARRPSDEHRDPCAYVLGVAVTDDALEPEQPRADRRRSFDRSGSDTPGQDGGGPSSRIRRRPRSFGTGGPSPGGPSSPPSGGPSARHEEPPHANDFTADTAITKIRIDVGTSRSLLLLVRRYHGVRFRASTALCEATAAAAARCLRRRWEMTRNQDTWQVNVDRGGVQS